MEQPPPAEPSSPRKQLGCALVLVSGFVALCGFAGGTMYWWLSRPAASTQPATVSVLRPTPTVITSMRQLALLQTTSFHMERVIDLRDQQSRFLGLLHSEDALLLVAAGDVSAGVDLSTLREEDVIVDARARSAKIVLPPAQILSATLDNQATYVHTRRTDVTARREETLETRARQEAERTLRDAALAGGILARAREGAERTVTSLARSLGYEVVELSFRQE